MATDWMSQITAWFQAVEYRTPPADDLVAFNAGLESGAMSVAQVQAAIINDDYTHTNVNHLIREYQVAFGRVPDQAGISYWTNAVADGKQTLKSLSVTFANSLEFQSRYDANADTLSNTRLVTALYANVLNRAPDAAGLAYWVGTGLNAAQLLDAFTDAYEFIQATAANVAAFQSLEMAGTPPTAGSLFEITTQPPPPPPIEPPSDPAPSLIFTAATDALVGTTGNDIFSGDNSRVPAVINSTDTVNGGSGVDTLNEIVGGTAFVLPQLNSIELVNVIGSTAVGGQHVDTSAVVGLTNLTFKNSTTGKDVATVADGVTVGFDNIKTTFALGATVETVNFAPTATSGALDIRDGTNLGDRLTVTGAALTSLSINSTGTASNSLSAVTFPVSTLIVTGDQMLTIAGQMSANITTVAAGGDTGGVNLTLGTVAANTNVSVTTGIGADTLSLANVTNTGDTVHVNLGDGNDVLKLGNNLNILDLSSTLNGGNGTDVVNIRQGADLTAATAALLSNFEVLDASGGIGNYDVSLGSFAKYEVDMGNSGSPTFVTFTNAPSNFDFEVISAPSMNAALPQMSEILKADSIAPAVDSLTVNLTSVDGNNNGIAEGNITIVGITSQQVENITIHANTLAVDSGLNTSSYLETVTTLTGLSLQTLTITGNESLKVTNSLAVGTVANLTKIDASGSSGNITLDYRLAASPVTYLGSAGVDTINHSNGGRVYGAGGNDLITLVAAVNTNADTLVYKAATDAQVTTSGVNVTAGQSVETVTNFQVAATSDGTHAADIIDLSGIGGFVGYARGASTIVGIDPLSGSFAASQTGFFNDGGGNRGVILAVVGADTFVFVDANHDGSFTAASDLVVKLAGVTNVAAADFNFG